MKVTFLGTGTSQGIPVIGCGCEVCKSPDKKNNRLRVSVWIQTDDKSMVIDSGPDFRYQMLRAGVDDLDAILYTHEHKDHVAGLDDIRPYNYILKKRIDIYATERVQDALKREFQYIFSEVKYHGLPQINLHTITHENFKVGETEIAPFEVMHYRLPILGYRIGDFTYITDAKTISEASLEKIKGTKVLVLNALQKESHISHLTFDEAIAMAEKVGAEMTYFTHISHNLGLHEEISKELPANIQLAYDGLTFNVD
ncbi:MBL fold metallo-hydrolase [Pedobacter xixiisoli]|uniref:Phosphoribosyl 1,2-cyclic phosphate phosphodiesterase n=1 Tax=Pedobacter xixiisoli TaxID=1476464 RepID=A0A285ZP31_9SPHI|nr:MBL fold metallo-hydrolase [Pedobacter xixiisoli]SOD11431.1 phosphoribosyl 1,2-cyclic phosphate phosphodiesterase [Pedobacter xixiisoli]